MRKPITFPDSKVSTLQSNVILNIWQFSKIFIILRIVWILISNRYEITMIIFGLVGIVYIITRSYLLQNVKASIPIASIRYALNCAQCTGFWVGFLFYLITTPDLVYTLQDSYYNPTLLETISPSTIISPFIYGGLISVLSSITINVLELIAFSKDWLITHTGQ
jgi:hypothetical protein